LERQCNIKTLDPIILVLQPFAQSSAKDNILWYDVQYL
jgi:hypothetical protein